MQKVESSSLFSRLSEKPCQSRGFSCWRHLSRGPISALHNTAGQHLKGRGVALGVGHLRVSQKVEAHSASASAHMSARFTVVGHLRARPSLGRLSGRWSGSICDQPEADLPADILDTRTECMDCMAGSKLSERSQADTDWPIDTAARPVSSQSTEANRAKRDPQLERRGLRRAKLASAGPDRFFNALAGLARNRVVHRGLWWLGGTV